jgi:phenylpropionate dioxygenase-like ring-hydroxylating dioxygenase large terminal subunit
MRLENRPGNQPDLRRIGLHPDFWYPLARSEDVRPGRTHRAAFAGEPIVLARTERGEVFALEDRCAHRQFPLHKGIVCGETLRCAYHAWTYRTDGRLVGVPYLPKNAVRPAGVRGFAFREAYGYVFVFPGDRDRAPAVDLPHLPSFHSPKTRTMRFWRKIDCHYSFMHENLMDMNHQSLHRGLMGTIRPTLFDHREGDDWVEARYRFERTAGKPRRGARFLMAGRRASGDTRIPDVMTIRTQYPYQTLSIRRGGSEEPAFNLWAAYVPWDREQRSHISVGMLMIEKPRIPGLGLRRLAPHTAIRRIGVRRGSHGRRDGAASVRRARERLESGGQPGDRRVARSAGSAWRASRSQRDPRGIIENARARRARGRDRRRGGERRRTHEALARNAPRPELLHRLRDASAPRSEACGGTAPRYGLFTATAMASR